MSTASPPTFPVVRFVFGSKETTGDVRGSGRPYTVVYDGQCKVCGRLVKLLEAWDTGRQIEVIPSQNSTVRARFPWIPPEAYVEAVQLIGPGGKTWQGSAAIEQLLEVLPKGGLLGWTFHIPGARTFADRFYKWFARNRYQFGCGEHCQLRPQNLNFGDES